MFSARVLRRRTGEFGGHKGPTGRVPTAATRHVLLRSLREELKAFTERAEPVQGSPTEGSHLIPLERGLAVLPIYEG